MNESVIYVKEIKGSELKLTLRCSQFDDELWSVPDSIPFFSLVSEYSAGHKLEPPLFLNLGSQPLLPNQTPEEVGLKDGDVLDFSRTDPDIIEVFISSIVS